MHVYVVEISFSEETWQTNSLGMLSEAYQFWLPPVLLGE